VGISHFIAARIRKFYGRRADVLYPPVVEQWERGTREDEQSTHPSQEIGPSQKKEAGYFLYAGAFVPYKGVEHIIEAFNELGLPLLCVGSGPLESALRKKAGENISFVGGVSDEQLGTLYRNARALIFPAKEDFGIIPIEALLSGTPVIAGYHGATRETVPGWRWWLREEWDPASHAGIFFPLRQKGRLQGESVYPRLLVETVEKFLDVEDTVRQETAIEAGTKFSLAVFREGWFRILQEEGMASSLDRKVINVQTADMRGAVTERRNLLGKGSQKRYSPDAVHHVEVEGETGEVVTGC
jgi:glycosyltransferase involved in cell wall biosynthesis